MTMRDNGRGATPGLIMRQMDPANLETPLEELDAYITPAELFYIRSHFTVPTPDVGSYRLRVDGAVKYPIVLTLEQLREMPSVTRMATLECAGNGRIFLVPQVAGAQWAVGAVGNAEWTGVPLRLLLERAGLADDATEIVLEGADRGTPNEQPVPPTPIAFARSLTRAKALRDEVLIAYAMNGRALPAPHGHPVRAVVPGHYGMASVKWLTHIEAVREPFRGYFQTTDYGYWDRMAANPVRRALGEIQLKSQIVRPRVYETLWPDVRYTIAGVAWAGEADVTGISVSTDGGTTWAEATFVDPLRRYAWRRWEFRWLTPRQQGRYTLLSRATSSDGSVQPDKHDPNHGTYVINHSLPIEVFVEASGG